MHVRVYQSIKSLEERKLTREEEAKNLLEEFGEENPGRGVSA